MHKVVYFFILLCFAACNNNTGKYDPVGSYTTVNALSPCYLYTTNKDTVLLQLTIKGDTVTGILVNSLYEKDANTGVVKGTFTNETLFLDYTFMSEGITSIREVTFLKTESGLIEGYGRMKDENGKTKFVSRSSIVYNGNMLLKPDSCR